MVGTVRHDGKDKEHAWNINPKGHIIDGSRDQFGDEKKIHIIKPNDKKHKEYTTNEAHLGRTPDHLYGRARKKLNRHYNRSHNEGSYKRSEDERKITAGMESLKSWESWLEKGRWDNPKHDTNTQKEFEAFEKLSKLPKNEVTELGDSIDEAIEGVKSGKLKKNNAIETSHKEGEKKEEWDGKFSSSTIRDDVKDDDKAVSEEESLEELTDGKLEEVEKLKSWELWLEKDALDGKGGNEAKMT